MKITAMDMQGISERMKPFLSSHFNDRGMILPYLPQDLFAESVLLDFSEVRHIIPEQNQADFNGNERFHASSGYIEVGTSNGELTEYTVILLTDEGFNTALLLCAQPVDDNGEVEIIKDFMEKRYGD